MISCAPRRTLTLACAAPATRKSAEIMRDDLARVWRRLLDRLRRDRVAAARPHRRTALVQDLRTADSAAHGRRRDRASSPRVDGLSLAVLGDDRARPDDVGDRSRRMDVGRGHRRTRNVVARVVYGLRTVRRRGSFARPAGAAAPWQPRGGDGDNGGRYRRYRRDGRLPLFAIRHRPRFNADERAADVPAAVALVRVPAVRGGGRHGRRRLCCARPAVGSNVPTPWHGAVRPCA